MPFPADSSNAAICFCCLYDKIICFDGYQNADLQSSPKEPCIYFHLNYLC